MSRRVLVFFHKCPAVFFELLKRKHIIERREMNLKDNAYSLPPPSKTESENEQGQYGSDKKAKQNGKA